MTLLDWPRADYVESCADRIRSTHTDWPPGHPAHPLVPGYLARTLGEEFIGDAKITAEAIGEIIRDAFTASGCEGDPVGLIIDMVSRDPALRPAAGVA